MVKKHIENIDVPNVDMSKHLKNFDNYSAIFIGGGNTSKLLKGKSIFAHYTNSETGEIHKKYTDY